MTDALCLKPAKVEQKQGSGTASYLTSVALPRAVVTVPKIALSEGSDDGEQGGSLLSILLAFIQHSRYVVDADPVLQTPWSQHPCILLI